MISMKSGISKLFLSIVLLTGYSSICRAQSDSARYDRPSLCLMMVGRSDMAYSSEIEDVFRQMDMPERFNDHGLGVRVFRVPQDGKPITTAIGSFIQHAEVAKKMISKWFGRNKETGCYNISLVQERGLYNTSIQDLNIAMHSFRGKAILADAGEKLIGHTFLVVNEFRYEKHLSINSEKAKTAKQVQTNLDLSNQSDRDAFREQVHEGVLLRDFTISCTSYLYQLVWNDEVAGTFYNAYYFDCDHLQPEKKQYYQQDKETFRLEYVGAYTDKLTEKNTLRLSTPNLVKKACVRITDLNIAKLQHKYPQFRIKAALVDESPLKAYIGMKEDVSPQSLYEVLEPELHEDGTYTYHRVGTIRPIADKIWDNRYMATEENRDDLDATYFEQVSGDELRKGLIIREL